MSRCKVRWVVKFGCLTDSDTHWWLACVAPTGCKGVIEGSHDSGDEVTIVNRYKSRVDLWLLRTVSLPERSSI
jgi:hypothetical protein